MPWKECHVMDERLPFVARLLEGEKMAPLCAEFGIPRKPATSSSSAIKDCGVPDYVEFAGVARRTGRFPQLVDSRSGVKRQGFVTISPSCLGPDTPVSP